MAEVVGMTMGLRTLEETQSVDDLLLSVIDETLRHVFKEAGTKVIYGYITNKCHLKREEIAKKPEIFSAGLESLLVSAARVIENLILKKLYRELGLKFEEKKGYEFSDYIEELKAKWDVNGRQARETTLPFEGAILQENGGGNL